MFLCGESVQEAIGRLVEASAHTTSVFASPYAHQQHVNASTAAPEPGFGPGPDPELDLDELFRASLLRSTAQTLVLRFRTRQLPPQASAGSPSASPFRGFSLRFDSTLKGLLVTCSSTWEQYTMRIFRINEHSA